MINTFSPYEWCALGIFAMGAWRMGYFHGDQMQFWGGCYLCLFWIFMASDLAAIGRREVEPSAYQAVGMLVGGGSFFAAMLYGRFQDRRHPSEEGVLEEEGSVPQMPTVQTDAPGFSAVEPERRVQIRE